jgi:hypothetical protein
MCWTMSGPSRFREDAGVGGMHQIFCCLGRFEWTGLIIASWIDISQVERLGVEGWGLASDFLLSKEVRVDGFKSLLVGLIFLKLKG